MIRIRAYGRPDRTASSVEGWANDPLRELPDPGGALSGFDGFLGTVYRYSQTLLEWNPGISVADTLDVVQGLFGIVLPGVGDDMLDFESALSPEFFEQVVTQETRRALASVDDPERIVPWLDTGRFPHDGDPMSA